MSILSIFEPSSNLMIIITILGGLGLFLFGIDFMSSSLKSLAGNKLKLLIEKATNNVFSGILTGFVVTILVQSSSATTVIIIGLISAGLMNLKQAAGVLIGANIGSTATAFLIGLNISDYSLLLVAIGAALLVFISTKRVKLTGQILLGFGLLFIGLELMGLGLSNYTSKPWFANAMIKLSDVPVLGVGVGAILTGIIQSSGASIGILQKIFADGNISLAGALAVMIGANIGTTVTVILASLKASKEAKQASLFHLFFNLFGAILMLFLFNPYLKLITLLETHIFHPQNKLTIAFAHIIFNLFAAIFMTLLINYFVKIVEKIIPSPKSLALSIVEKLNYNLIKSSPVLAIESAKSAVLEMGEIAIKMVGHARAYQSEYISGCFEEIARLEDEIDLYDNAIHDYLMEVQTTNLSTKYKQMQIILLDTIRDFERIADHAVNLSEFYTWRYEQGCVLGGNLSQNLCHYFELVVNQLNTAFNSFKLDSKQLAFQVTKAEDEINNLEKVYRRAQLLENKENSKDNSSECSDLYYVDILSNLERIGDHCVNIAENIIDPHYLSKDRTSKR